MCGLVGLMSSNFLQKHKDCLASLLYVDTWRGQDSTGVAAIRNNADTCTLKSTIPGYEFVQGPRLSTHLRLNDFLWIGHNRHGTVGRNVKTNAHPFEIDDEDGCCLLVGAHNGTLKNKHVLMDDQSFGTDSEALYNEIAKTNLRDTLAKVEGAWALTYYDHITEEFRVVRNKERTLYYAWEKGKKTLIWASEMWMISVCASRSGIELEEIDGVKIRPFEEDTLYKFPAPMKMNDEITLSTEEGYAGKAPAFFRQPGQETWRNWEEKEQATTGKTTASSSTSVVSNSNSGTNVVPLGLPDPQNSTQSSGKHSSAPLVGKVYKGYEGELLTYTEITTQLKGGCSWCETEEIELTDRFAWLEPGKPVCEKCLRGIKEEPVSAASAERAATVH